MGHIAKDINRITGTIIGISGKLILYALVILLLAEGITRGYAFGHEIFYSKAMEAAPGTEKTVVIPEGQSTTETIHVLREYGLIDNELAIQIQMKFYEYEIQPGTYSLNTSMTSKEILRMLNDEAQESESEIEADDGTGQTEPDSETINFIEEEGQIAPEDMEMVPEDTVVIPEDGGTQG
ncbi:MAG: endolytic transglycosylase MltG [Lachnospiraceae bacterium]|nr:endolytic transglycosylase MltG [Lachnospiraceae bacterium]